MRPRPRTEPAGNIIRKPVIVNERGDGTQARTSGVAGIAVSVKPERMFRSAFKQFCNLNGLTFIPVEPGFTRNGYKHRQGKSEPDNRTIPTEFQVNGEPDALYELVQDGMGFTAAPGLPYLESWSYVIAVRPPRGCAGSGELTPSAARRIAHDRSERIERAIEQSRKRTF